MKNRYLLLLVIVLCCTGCHADYYLDIGKNDFQEKIVLMATSSNDNERIIEYPITVFYNDGGNNIDPKVKNEGSIYYKSKSKKIGEFKQLEYSHLFSGNDILKSRAIHSSFDRFVFERYDHNNNFKLDYMLISTTNSFSWFDIYDNLDSVTIHIVCHYKVISSNADEVNDNEYIWHFTKNNMKGVNMVYDPDSFIDDRTLFEKIMDGEYLNIFTVSLFLCLVGYVVYSFLKKKGERRNRL